MKYVFVGDVHGKVRAVEAALAREGKKIFVGDFIDSFDHPVEDHKICYDLVLEAIDKGEAEALFGNHELSYLMPNKHRCSGFDATRATLMYAYKERLFQKFKPYLLLRENFLVSHAGLTKTIWDVKNLDISTLSDTLAKWWANEQSAMHWVGRARGGPDRCGGLFWCDFNHEFRPVDELEQVFGHTRGMGIRTFDRRNWCIDTLDWHKDDPHFLELEI